MLFTLYLNHQSFYLHQRKIPSNGLKKQITKQKKVAMFLPEPDSEALFFWKAAKNKMGKNRLTIKHAKSADENFSNNQNSFFGEIVFFFSSFFEFFFLSNVKSVMEHFTLIFIPKQKLV